MTTEQKHEEMKLVLVNTLDGKETLYDLCEEIGIKQRVFYFNYVERKSKNVFGGFKVRKVIHDRGFIFNNGLQIRHVAPKYVGCIKIHHCLRSERKKYD